METLDSPGLLEFWCRLLLIGVFHLRACTYCYQSGLSLPSAAGPRLLSKAKLPRPPH